MRIDKVKDVAERKIKEILSDNFKFDGDISIVDVYPVESNLYVGSFKIEGSSENVPFKFHLDYRDVSLDYTDLQGLLKPFRFYHDGYFYNVKAFNKRHASYLLADKFLSESEGFFRYGARVYNRMNFDYLVSELEKKVIDNSPTFDNKKEGVLEFEADIFESEDDSYPVDFSNDLELEEGMVDYTETYKELFASLLSNRLKKMGAKDVDIVIEDIDNKGNDYYGVVDIKVDNYDVKTQFNFKTANFDIVAAKVNLGSLYSLNSIKVYSFNVDGKEYKIAGFDLTAVYYALKDILGPEGKDLKFEDVYKYGIMVKDGSGVNIIDDAQENNPWEIIKNDNEIFIKRKE